MTLWVLFLAQVKMLYRNRMALFWALVFPILFVAVFGLFFREETPTITLAVVDRAGDSLSQRLVESLSRVPQFKIKAVDGEEEARRMLANGDIHYLLVLPPGLAADLGRAREGEPVRLTLVYDQGQAFSGVVISTVRRFVDQVNLEMAGAPRLLEVQEEGAITRQVDYFDFLLPGFVGIGVMNYAIIGMAVTIAHFRQQRVLKRIMATPLRVRNFVVTMVLANLCLSLVQAGIILVVGVFAFGGRVYGNPLWIFLVVVLANIVFLNLGLISGSLARNVNAASGVGNAVSLPMMFLSGAFFPKENLPAFLARAVDFLPLTPMMDMMRGVTLEAKVPWDYPLSLGVLVAWILLSSLLAVRTFRYD